MNLELIKKQLEKDLEERQLYVGGYSDKIQQKEALEEQINAINKELEAFSDVESIKAEIEEIESMIDEITNQTVNTSN